MENQPITVSFIGCGNMGYAILQGLLVSGQVNPSNVFVCEKDINQAKRIQQQCNAKIQTIKNALNQTKYVFFCVKPNGVQQTLQEMKPYLDFNKHVIISIVAGYSLKTYENLLPKGKFIRIMLNIAAKVKQSSSLISSGSKISTQEIKIAKIMLESIGTADQIGQELMDSVTAISGSGVAFVITFIETLQNAGVREGIPRHLARKLALQTALGTTMLMDNICKQKGHDKFVPAGLRGEVQSPGGCTIAGSAVLQSQGFQRAVYLAVRQAVKRTKQLGQISKM